MSRSKLAEGSYSSVLCPESAYIRAADAYLKMGQAAERLIAVLEDRTSPMTFPELDDEDSLVVALKDCASGGTRAPTERTPK